MLGLLQIKDKLKKKWLNSHNNLIKIRIWTIKVKYKIKNLAKMTVKVWKLKSQVTA